MEAKPKVFHSDQLKPYLGPPLDSWIPKQRLSNPRKTGKAKLDVASPILVEDGLPAPVVECREIKVAVETSIGIA